MDIVKKKILSRVECIRTCHFLNFKDVLNCVWFYGYCKKKDSKPCRMYQNMPFSELQGCAKLCVRQTFCSLNCLQVLFAVMIPLLQNMTCC